MPQNIIDTLPIAIVETLLAPADTGEQWARYVELLNLQKPTVGQQREFAELVGKLKLTPALCKLHLAVLATEADRQEKIRGVDEAELQAGELAALAGASAQALRRDCVLAGITPNVEYRPEDSRRQDEAHEALRVVRDNRNDLQTIYFVFPQLFGLPPTKKRKASAWTCPPKLRPWRRRLASLLRAFTKTNHPFSERGIFMAKTKTKPEPVLPWRERQEQRVNAGLDFYPRVRGEMSQHDWEMLFDAHEGALPPSKLLEKLRTLYDRPWPRILQEALHHDGMILPPAGDDEVYRLFFQGVGRVRTGAAVSGGNVSGAAFQNRINSWVLDGYAEGQDSLDSIVAQDELTNYLPAPILQSLDTHSFRPVPKGGEADDTQLSVQPFGDWRLTRFGRKATIDEQDMVNDVPGSLRKNLAALGRAAKRCWLDWAWSLILANPLLDLDGLAHFENTVHKNLVTTPLSDLNATIPTANAGPLLAAMAMIRRQHIATDDAGQIQHLNLRPAYFIVAPELEGAARQLLREQMLFDDRLDLELRVESRLTDIGVKNPLTQQVITGSRSNWLLSADGTIAPWLLRGVLEGADGPKIRMAELSPKDDPGQFGLAVDVSQAIACKLADFRGCVFGTGTN